MTDLADIVIPDDADGLEEFLNSKDFARVVDNPDKMAELTAKYADAAYAKGASDGAEMQRHREDLEVKAYRKFLEDNNEDPAEFVNKARAAASGAAPVAYDQPPARLDPHAQAAYRRIYNAAAPGADAHGLFDSGAEYLQAIWHGTRGGELVNKRHQLETIQNAYTSTIGADGGFLIPEQMRAELLSVALQTAVVRPRARVLPMSTPRVPIPSIDETTRVGSVFGGIVAYWTEEQAAATESAAKFGQIALEAKKLTAYTEIPNETIQDAILFGAFFDQTFPQAMSHFEDLAFTTGTGVGEPLGWQSAGGMVTVAKEGSQTADTVVWANVVKMFARLFPSSIGNAVWVVAPDVFPQLAQMELANGGGGLWIGPSEGTMAPPSTLLGRPVVTSDKVPVVGDLGDITLIDFSYYLIGDRQTMTATSSEHFRFNQGKTSFLITERVDGRPWLESAITPPNSGPTLSAYVNLAARA